MEETDWKEFWKEDFSEMYDHIIHDCASDMYQWRQYRKGRIIANDESNEMLDFVKEHLRYDELKKAGKICELTIDESWNSFIKKGCNNGNARKCRNKLVAAAYKANHGLLVIDVSNIRIFSLCWHLKQLAKQEEPLEAWYPYDNDFDSLDIEDPYKFMFDGYVLIVIKGIEWNSVIDYACEHQETQFQAMMDFYRRIRF